MRSSTGLYVSRLDHVRALAAFMVYCYHVVHIQVPKEAVPGFFPLSLFEEGHAGVGLFMTLSGYLFAKILDGRAVDLLRFYANRFLRLAPLLAAVFLYWAARGDFDPSIFPGVLLSRPLGPHGTWSVFVELQFYAIFPILLFMQRWHRIVPLAAILVLSVAFKAAIWHAGYNLHWHSYFTIVGCIDLFVCGMLWHELAKTRLMREHSGLVFCLAGLGFTVFWHLANAGDGLRAGQPSSPLWIVIPAIQGLAFGAVMSAYERLDFAMPAWADRTLAKIGEVSYSIYLLHFIVYVQIIEYCGAAGFDLGNINVVLLLALMTFPIIVLLAMVSYRVIEQPFFRWRMNYVVRESAAKPSKAPQWVPAT